MANKLQFSNGCFEHGKVQKYDCLYNNYSKEFKDRNKKDNAWKEVASRFEDLSPSEATERLKNIRSFHTRFLKEKKKTLSGSGRDAVPKQFENLEWLSIYIEHRATWSSVQFSSFYSSYFKKKYKIYIQIQIYKNINILSINLIKEESLNSRASDKPPPTPPPHPKSTNNFLSC